MNICGYLINDSEGKLQGEPGEHYNYIMASNGLFIQSENRFLKATMPIGGPAVVRGLAPLIPGIELKHGRLPMYLFGDAMKSMQEDLSRELYLAVVWTGSRYMINRPNQEASGAGVTYDKLPNTALDMHSHPISAGIFSGTDNRDEVGFQLYGVIGKLHTLNPEYSFRVGVYGEFMDLDLEEIFV